MNEDFVTRLGVQLRSAEERELRRGLAARIAAAARWRVLTPPVLVGAAAACAAALVIALVASGTLRHHQPQPLPAGRSLHVVVTGDFVSQGGWIESGFGSAWASDGSTGNLLRVDPNSGRVIARLRLGGPASISTRAGAVWATAGSRLVRIDPATNKIVARIPVSGVPAGKFAALFEARGYIWLATYTELRRVDPRRNAIDRVVPVESNSYAARGLVTDHERLYVLRGDGVLLVLDGATGARVSSLRLAPDEYPLGAANGALMATHGREVVARDVRTGRTLWRTNVDAQRFNDSFVAGDRLWIQVTDERTNRDREIGIDVRNGHVTGSATLTDFGVAGSAVVGDAVWVVTPGGRLMVVR